VPATIQSRSQVFELRTLPFGAIREQLKQVTAGEDVVIDDAALALVARSAEGSMRDALSALDQVLAFASGPVTEADVSAVLGVIGRDMQFEIVEAVAREDMAAAFAKAAAVVEAGFDLRIVCRELARLVRDLMVVRIDPTRLADREIAAEGDEARLKALADRYSREDLMRAFDLLSKAETDIKASSQPRHHFEMTLVKWIHLRQLTPLSELIANAESGAAPRPQTPATRPASVSGPRTQDAAPRTQKPGPRPQDSGPRTQESGPRTPDAGPRIQEPGPRTDLKSTVLSSIREQNKAFYGMVVAQAQKIEVEGTSVVFTFAPVHRTLKAQLEARKGWVEQLAHAASGRRMSVVARESEPAPAPAADAADEAAAARRADLRARARAEPTVQAVLDVFGGEIEDVEEI
jgi:DNA polymerase-3 subunit gamma/tau